jgi:hypothetical protein
MRNEICHQKSERWYACDHNLNIGRGEGESARARERERERERGEREKESEREKERERSRMHAWCIHRTSYIIHHISLPYMHHTSSSYFIHTSYIIHHISDTSYHTSLHHASYIIHHHHASCIMHHAWYIILTLHHTSVPRCNNMMSVTMSGMKYEVYDTVFCD